MNRLALAKVQSFTTVRRLWLPCVVAALLLWAFLVLGHYYVRLWEFLAQSQAVQVRLYGSAALPYFREALARAAGGLGGASVLLIAAYALGDLICRGLRWRFTEWQARLVYAAVLGLGAFANLGLALALVGVYRPGVLRGLVAATLLLAALVHWPAVARAFAGWRAAAGAGARRGWRQGPRPGRAWLWIGCAALAAGSALVAALAPEVEYDALWFHLEYPRLFLDHGRLVDRPYDYVSLYPMTWELWFGYGLALGGPVAAKLLHFATLPLTAAMVFLLARRYVPGASPWLAVALFATVPTVLWEASTAYIDLALGLHLTLLLYGLLRYRDTRQAQWLLLAAINLGLALATKHLALVYLALAGAGLAVALWVRQWRSGADEPRAVRAARVLGPLLLFGLIALALPLPWYLRSLAGSGNPFFPELYGVFGAPAERWDAATHAGLERFLNHFGPPRTLGSLLTLPWHMTIHAAAYDGALGPLFLLLLPGLALRRLRGAVPWLLAFVAGFLAVWASPLASFQMRFVMPLTPLLAVLAASAAARWGAVLRAACGRGVPAVAAPLLALLCVLNLPFFTTLHEVDRQGDNGWLNSVLRGVPLSVVVGAESQTAYLRRQVRSYAVWDYANHHLPAEARVLTWAGGDQFYADRAWLWANAAMARPTAWAPAGSLPQALAGLRSLGVDYLLLDRRPLPEGDDWEHYALTSAAAVEHGYLHELFSDRGYALYRVAAPGAAQP